MLSVNDMYQKLATAGVMKVTLGITPEKVPVVVAEQQITREKGVSMLHHQYQGDTHEDAVRALLLVAVRVNALQPLAIDPGAGRQNLS